MDSGGLYEVVEKIFFGVRFIALGGILLAVFFFMFAPNLMGINSVSKQLEGLQKQLEELNRRLGKNEGKKNDNSSGQNDSQQR